jgi:hypothetical protein
MAVRTLEPDPFEFDEPQAASAIEKMTASVTRAGMV